MMMQLPGFTLASDVRNIVLRDNFLTYKGDVRRERPNVKHLRTFDISSEESFRKYDASKAVLGLVKAVDNCHTSSFNIVDAEENKVPLLSSNNPNSHYLTKIFVSENAEVPVTIDKIEFSDHVKENLTDLFEKWQSDGQNSAVFAKPFFKNHGSHFNYGKLLFGDYFEIVVTWQKHGKSEGDLSIEKKNAECVLKECEKNVKSSNMWFPASDVMSESEYEKYNCFDVRISHSLLGHLTLVEWQEKIEKKKETGNVLVSGDVKVVPAWRVVKDDKQFSPDFAAFLREVWQNQIRDEKILYNRMAESLGIAPHLDQPISVHQARALTVEMKKEPASYKDAMWLILERLMRCDAGCKSLKGFTNPLILDGTDNMTVHVHVMDVFLLLYTNCDLLLQMELASKLAQCRLSIPFIIPHPVQLKVLAAPLKSVSLEWKSSDGSTIHSSLAKHCFKTVSFIRIGKLSISKSRFMNGLATDTETNTFFHRDDIGGKKKRKISNGLVEMSYILPYKNNKDDIILLNLRGDVQDYPDQFDMLTRMSDILVVLIDHSKISKVKAYLNGLKKNNLIVIIVGEPEDDMTEFKSESSSWKVIKECEKTTKELQELVIKNINEGSKPKHNILERTKKMMRNINAKISLDDEEFSGISDEVENVVKTIKDTSKNEIVPLQGDSFHEWAKLLKKLHRQLKGLESEEALKEKEMIKSQMFQIRQQQRKMLPLHRGVKSFVQILRQHRAVFEHTLYCKLTSSELDRLSKPNVDQLLKEYVSLGSDRKEEIQKLDKKLSEASFGSEHLLRELGQLYETLKQADDTTKDERQWLECLPKIAAKYFLHGNPLEIMDGDSGVVPLTWIHAILDSIQKMIGNKKMAVLSVLGVQSSGKSTLLNTMFGLGFAVSAGRCTRGIYAHLIPVPVQSSQKHPFDYLMVLDSEGLCGIQRDSLRQNDNEIATLVIGLADFTIINMKGENLEQIKEILDIVVHTFLRMKMVKEYKRQQCIFVHQNVSDINAKDQLTVERTKLQEHLDEVTKSAADAQNRSKTINKFQHVIDFHKEKSFFYVPEFRTGKQPMTMINSDYSTKVEEIRDYILKEIYLGNAYVTAESLKTRIQDMWDGVLGEDFLFTFRNNESIKAYLQLETKFYHLRRDLESNVEKFVNESAKASIEKSDTLGILDTTFANQNQELQELIGKETDEVRANLNKFVEENPLKVLLVKLIDKRLISLEQFKKDLEKEMKWHLKYLYDSRKLEIELLSEENQWVKKVSEVAEELKTGSCSDEAIKERFKAIWDDIKLQINTFIKSKIDVSKAPFDLEVKKQVKEALVEVFEARGLVKFVTSEMETSRTSNDDFTHHFTENEMKKEYLENRVFKADSNIVWKGTVLSEHKSRSEYFSRLVEEANKFIDTIKEELKSMNKYGYFKKWMAHSIFRFISAELKKRNDDKSIPFDLTPSFEAMLAVHVARIAILHFETMNQTFKDTGSTDAKLKSFESKLQKLFIQLVGESLHDGGINFFFEYLKDHILDVVECDITRKVLDYMLKDVGFTKHKLLAEALLKLGEDDDFDEYMVFIKDVYMYCYTMIMKKSQVKLFDNESEMNYKTIAREKIADILSNVKQAFDNTMKNELFSSEILKEEMKTVPSIPLSDNDFKLLEKLNSMSHKEAQDKIQRLLSSLKDEVNEHFNKISSESIQWKGENPFEQVMGKVWGCKEKCPFCYSPCIHTTADHLSTGPVSNELSHRCLQHWPYGVRGIRWQHTQILCHEICTFSVTTDTTKFWCGVTDLKCQESESCQGKGSTNQTTHYYKDYRSFFPNFDIKPDHSGEASPFWMWMMARHRDKLVEKHNTKGLEIPESWKSITKEDALNSLDFYHSN